VKGNVFVGFIVFIIIVLVQFNSLSQRAPNACREVTARLTLDAMPGKQMGIDADLNAGLIFGGDGARKTL
jgi:flagellar biosynthesis component FlhA